MEKFKFSLYDIDQKSFEEMYNAAGSYYMFSDMDVYSRYQKFTADNNVWQLSRSNVQAALKLMSTYVDYVGPAEAEVFRLRFAYVRIKKHFDKFEEDFGLKEVLTKRDSSIHYSNVFGGDCLSLAFYLAASDGQLAVAETEFIEGVVRMGLTQSMTLELIKDSSMVDEEGREKYANTALSSLSIALISDKFYTAKPELYQHSLYGGVNLASTVMAFYKDFGMGLVGVDGDVSEEEKQDIDKLLKNLEIVSSAFANQVKS